jgi:hypothetical protein
MSYLDSDGASGASLSHETVRQACCEGGRAHKVTSGAHRGKAWRDPPPAPTW